MSERSFSAEIGSHGRFDSSAITHEGAVRKRNEDSYMSCPDLGVWAVADGVGGHQAGDVASRTVTDALRTVPLGLDAAQLLIEVRSRLDGAHQELLTQAASRGPSTIMASTVVVLLARGDYFACLWAGDSRAYLLRDGLIKQVTHDHSLVQEMVDAHAISLEEAETHPQSNVITRAVGSGASLELDKVSDQLYSGDRFLLCSDGLWKTLHADELAGLLTVDGNAPAEELLAAALERHSNDNVTAVTIEVRNEDGTAPEPVPRRAPPTAVSDAGDTASPSWLVRLIRKLREIPAKIFS
jgi:protein phosphatase/serine/threonine-protein phosphatase Stp1